MSIFRNFFNSFGIGFGFGMYMNNPFFASFCNPFSFNNPFMCGGFNFVSPSIFGMQMPNFSAGNLNLPNFTLSGSSGGMNFVNTSAPIFNTGGSFVLNTDTFVRTPSFTLSSQTKTENIGSSESSSQSKTQRSTSPDNGDSRTNVRVNTRYSGTADDLNKQLGGVLKNKGNVFIEAEKKYGINAGFLAAVCMHESGNGSSKIAKELNNVGGVRRSCSTEFKKYGSVDECIMHMAKFLKAGYIDKGLVTIAQIGRKYCPISDPTDKKHLNSGWASGVASKYSQLA